MIGPAAALLCAAPMAAADDIVLDEPILLENLRQSTGLMTKFQSRDCEAQSVFSKDCNAIQKLWGPRPHGPGPSLSCKLTPHKERP